MDKSKINEKLKDFVVIGIGRLGENVAKHLFALGNEVLAIDKSQSKINRLADKVTTAVSADTTSYDVLFSLGVQNFDCAIVCIRDDLEGSLLTAQVCKDLGVKYIIALARSEEHGKILKAMGVNLVVYPEEFVGAKLASLLSKPGVNELIELTEEFKIFEMKLPMAWENKAIVDINIRKKYKLTIVFVKRGDDVISPEPDTVLQDGDVLVVAGESSKINSVANLINDASDIKEQLERIFSDK